MHLHIIMKVIMATNLNSLFIGSITEVNSVKSCSLLGYKLFTSSSSVCFSGQKKGLSGVGIKAMFKGTHDREMKLTEMIENKVTEAKEVCAGDKDSDECKVAWDEVEEISQAKAHLRVKLEHDEDPLDSFCSGNPETDECSVYDD